MNDLQEYQDEFYHLLTAQRDLLEEKHLLEEEGKIYTPTWQRAQDQLEKVNDKIFNGIV